MSDTADSLDRDSRPKQRADEVRAALRDVAPVLPAVLPFAALYGALATAFGFHPALTLIASATIFAGASQYLMLDLLGQGLTTLPIVLAVLAVNFRHVLYSAALGRRLGRFTGLQKALGFALMVDPTFAAGETRARVTGSLSPAYYFTYALAVFIGWMVFVALGVAFGSLIDEPARYGLDFVLPLYFLSVLLGFRQSAGFLPVLAASAATAVAVHALAGAPWHILGGALTGLLAAALLARDPHAAGAHETVAGDPVAETEDAVHAGKSTTP